MQVSSVEEMRRLDARASEEFGVPDHVLMENAGQAVYYTILRRLGVRGRRFVVLAGPGNNGGDGLVAARKLHSTGGRVRVLVLADPGGYAGAGRLNYEMLVRSGAEILVEPTRDDVVEALAWCDVVVDGLLGTGITAAVGGRFRDAIEQVNGAGRPVIAIDIPSGVDGDTGKVRGVAVRADTTVTFGLPKRGNLLGPGAELCGRLVVTHISFPPDLTGSTGIHVAIGEPALLARPGEAGSGDRRGVLFIAAGGDGSGAVGLAPRALLAGGGRRCRLAAPRSVTSRLTDLPDGVEVLPQDETEPGCLESNAIDGVVELARGADLVVLGGGPSSCEDTRELVRQLGSSIPAPLVVCGGVAGLPANLRALRGRTHPTVLMLASGELSRLAAQSESGVADPISLVQGVAEDLDVVLVAMEVRTLIGLPDRRVLINPGHTPDPESGHSRDVATGIIAAAFVRGLPLEKAVVTGVFLHGMAGDLAGPSRRRANSGGGSRELVDGGAGLRRVLERIPAAVKAYTGNYSRLTADCCGAMEVI